MRKIAVFDCCGTITKTNNTFHFINFVTKDNLFKRVLFRIIVALKVLNLSKISRKDLSRTLAIKLLKGYSEDEMRQKAREYVALIDQKGLFNSQITDLISEEKQRKDEVLIISASINPPIEEISKKLDIKKYFCSQLEIKNGKYTGRLKVDLLNNKNMIVKKDLKNTDFNNSSFYSDNLEDLKVMEMFGSFYPIITSPWNNGLWEKRLKNKKAECLISTNENRDYEKTRSLWHTSYITGKNKNLLYIPTLYYFLTRYRPIGILLENILPMWFVVFFISALNSLNSAAIVLVSFFLFFAIYEIGALHNDFRAFKEKKDIATIRLPKNININVPLFIFLRIGIAMLMLRYLSDHGYPIIFYVIGMTLCMIVFFIHNMISNRFRIVTFFLLRIFYLLIPLLFLVNKLAILPVFFAFFINEAPKRIYFYVAKKNQKQNLYDSLRNRVLYYVIMIVIGFLIYLLTNTVLFVSLSLYLLAWAIFGFYSGQIITKYSL